MRDLDVFALHVLTYRDSRPQDARAEVEPLVAAIETRRSQARERLLDDLNARRYHTFKRAFAMLLTTPGADLAQRDGVDATTGVRDVAGSAIWRRYEQWRAHEGALVNPTEEFFADALGPNVERVLTPLIALQENLGALQDGVVAQGHVAALGLSDDFGAQAYLAARDAERAAHLVELPRRWEKVGSATYRRQLTLLVALAPASRRAHFGVAVPVRYPAQAAYG